MSHFSGRTYDLGVPLSRFTPVSPLHAQFTLKLFARHGDILNQPGNWTYASEIIVMSGHTGTHIDGLGHVSCNGVSYGGVDAMANQHGGFLKELDIASVAPIVCRGVMLDIANLKGVDVLPSGYAVTAQDLAAAEENQGVKVQAGDAVLIRTGWHKHFRNANLFLTGGPEGTPGPDLSAANWLMERRIRVTGDETVAYEVHGPDHHLPVHPALLVDAGIHIIEVMNLEPLAADRVSEFTFVCSPLPFVGGTGSPVRPVAITS